MRQLIVNVPAGQDTRLCPSYATRTYLGLVNTGAGNANLAFGNGVAAAQDAGWPLDAAPANGRAGGGITWSQAEGCPKDEVHVYSAAGTTIVVLEG